jgi:hypothetical protein
VLVSLKECITLQLVAFVRLKECITLQSVARVSRDCKSHGMYCYTVSSACESQRIYYATVSSTSMSQGICYAINGIACKSQGRDRAIAVAVSRRLPTAAARILSPVKSCGSSGGQSGTGVGSLRVLRLLLPILIPRNAPYSFVIRGW